MSDAREDHEVLDDFIGDCAAYSMFGDEGNATMEPDIDGEWVRMSDVEANVLRGIAKNNAPGRSAMNDPAQRMILSAHEAAAEAKLMLDPDALLIALSAHVDGHFGPPCAASDPNCLTCQMWAAMATIRNGLAEAGAFDEMGVQNRGPK